MIPKSRQARSKAVTQRDIKTKSNVSPASVTKKINLSEKSMTADRTPGNGRGKGKPPAHAGRRSSSRLRTRSSTGSSGKSLMADSAYDGDEESSPSTTQSEGDDPYSIATLEDVPAVSRASRKKRVKVANKGKVGKTTEGGKSAITPSTHTSSTPNQMAQNAVGRMTRSSPRLNATPEVTPILPVKPLDVVSPIEPSLSTPQLCQSPCITTSLQSSSQGDSGIALSPPAKRARVQPGEPRHKSALGKKFMNKRNIFSPNSKKSSVLPETKENMDTSCFGFSSMDSPRELTLGVKRKLPAESEYRNTQPMISDSSPSRPLLSTDSENWPDSSQRQFPSPGLFSDDVFSADSESLTVNRSISRTYKPSKARKLNSQPKKSISKFEAWANTKNMEFEDVEKFDLNIE